MSKSRTFTINSMTTPEQVAAIPQAYTRVAVANISSPDVIVAIPGHIREIEVLDEKSIKYLRGTLTHSGLNIDTLIVSDRTPLAALQAVSPRITQAIVLAGTDIDKFRGGFHSSIKKIDYQSLPQPLPQPKPQVIDLVSDEEEVELLEQPVQAIEHFEKEILRKGTKINDIKKFTGSIVWVLSGSTRTFYNVPPCVKRFEFGENVYENEAWDFPGGLRQVKLLEGVGSNPVAVLKGSITSIVLGKKLELRVMQKAKEKVKNIAVAIEDNIEPFLATTYLRLDINKVEIDEKTTVEAVKLLQGYKVASVWLGHNVKPEVVAAIPREIPEVVIGFNVSRQAAEVISKEKRIICADGVEFEKYLDLIQEAGQAGVELEDSAVELLGQGLGSYLHQLGGLGLQPLFDAALLADPQTPSTPEMQELAQLFLELGSRLITAAPAATLFRPAPLPSPTAPRAREVVVLDDESPTSLKRPVQQASEAEARPAKRRRTEAAAPTTFHFRFSSTNPNVSLRVSVDSLDAASPQSPSSNI